MDDQLGGFKVVKLNDDNFHVWKQRIQLVLALLKCVSILSHVVEGVICDT